MKIIWAINVPVKGSEIDFEASDKKRKALEKERDDFVPFSEYRVIVPCVRNKDFSFELCENCGSQITGGRLRRGWRSCSKECNQAIGSAWAQHTLVIERQQKGKRPMFFWYRIRGECFERDDYRCRTCGKDIRLENKPGEAHHIIPISEGGTNELSNLETLCYDCHKLKHSHAGKMIRVHKTLDNF